MGFIRRVLGMRGNPDTAVVRAKIEEIEAEMRRVGLWAESSPEPEQLQVHAAFGGDKLTFEEWLQFIFIPRVREALASNGPWPSGSQVSDQAFREWQMWGSEDHLLPLIDLLRQFDRLF